MMLPQSTRKLATQKKKLIRLHCDLQFARKKGDKLSELVFVCVYLPVLNLVKLKIVGDATTRGDKKKK